MDDGRLARGDWLRASEIHQASLARMLAIAQARGRVRAGEGVWVEFEEGTRLVPMVLFGFNWKPADVQEIHAVGAYQTEVLTRHQQRAGLGVPVVVRRRQATNQHAEERFLPKPATFAATVVLRPSAPASGLPASLEFYCPLATENVSVGGRSVPLAADFSAPFAFHYLNSSTERSVRTMFVNPDTPDTAEGLFFLDPYERGKIPVIFVHGLLSSPETWVDLASELRTLPDFDERYQIWAFRYASSAPFLRAGARMRAATREALATIDPNGEDPALRQMVIVGHSLGGLVARLQVTSSGNHLWQAVATRPFAQLEADPQTRTQLAELFFFAPEPHIRRVVFLATPHQGSPWADRIIGQVGASVVHRDANTNHIHDQLVAANPGMFREEMQTRIPTSIDLLKPESQLLAAVRCLPTPASVHTHSVIGTGRTIITDGPADGVVTVASARLPGVASEEYVPVTHTWVHRDPRTVAEIARILREHWAAYVQECAAVAACLSP